MKKLLLISFAVLAFAACGEGSRQPSGLAMPTIEGKIYDFAAASAQRPVFVLSAAGFCGYCKMMIPLVDAMAADYAGKDVDFVVAFVDDNGAAVKELAQSLGIKNMKVLYNGSPLAEAMGVQGFPAMYLLDETSNGAAIAEWGGYNPDYIADIKAKVDAALS